jgi:transglutaminase-like putative cysteine protease
MMLSQAIPHSSPIPADGDARKVARRLRIRHRTTYRYDHLVPRSVHRVHLRPIDDWTQTVLSYRLRVTPDVPLIEYEDVFGNWVTRFTVDQPYCELTIESESVVEIRDVDPFAFADMSVPRPSIPLVWMPWEQKMLTPYLTPDELPDTQLQALYEYAMSFVKRNDGDLMESLFSINLALFREFDYVSDATSLETTPFQVYQSGQGVCQDFANLFITMARLLGVPARYVCGYLYTGNNAESRTRSDASHAWVQLYIPDIGWKGFDPTNGVLPHRDHVRVGYGRHYRDTAPTSGTLFGTGAGEETMEIEVVVAEEGSGGRSQESVEGSAPPPSSP